LFFPKGRELKHTDRFEMPNISRVDYDFGPDRHFIITSQCTPIAEFETEVYTVMTFRFGFIGALVRILFEPLSRHIIRQDVDVLRAQTRQIRRFEGPRFSHVEPICWTEDSRLRRCAERNEVPGKEEEKPVRSPFVSETAALPQVTLRHRWPLVSSVAALSAASAVFAWRQNHLAVVGGPISMAKTLWLNYMLIAMYIVPFFLCERRPSRRQRAACLAACL